MSDDPHYIAAVNLPTRERIEVGALGEYTFPAGDYAYVGRAKRGFDARLARHRRLDDKTIRWHFDYLRAAGRWIEARTPHAESECTLADRLADRAGAERFVDGFGASDCRCGGHLVRFEGEAQLPGELWRGDGVEGRFLERPNRFVVHVELDDGREVRAYLPNTSRLTELLEPGRTMLLEPADDESRSTDYTVRRIDDGRWVSVEATGAETVVEQEMANTGRLPGLGPVEEWRSQVTHHEHRFDFLLTRPDGSETWLEVKSLSRCFDGDAILSGTPSRRGVDHLDTLGEMAEAGLETALVFVLQRPDPERLLLGEGPDGADVDADWLSAVRRARRRDVDILAHRCRITPTNAWIEGRIPVVDDRNG